MDREEDDCQPSCLGGQADGDVNTQGAGYHHSLQGSAQRRLRDHLHASHWVDGAGKQAGDAAGSGEVASPAPRQESRGPEAALPEVVGQVAELGWRLGASDGRAQREQGGDAIIGAGHSVSAGTTASDVISLGLSISYMDVLDFTAMKKYKCHYLLTAKDNHKEKVKNYSLGVLHA